MKFAKIAGFGDNSSKLVVPPSFMRKRNLWLLIGLLIVVALIGTTIFLRAKGAPEAARLLPESDAVIYLNLKPLRTAFHFGDKPVNHEPEYEEFVRQTGFQFERDLDEAAVAVHPAEVAESGGSVEAQRRFSEIFIGRFDHDKLTHYLHKISTSVDRYHDHEIFLVPHEGRPVRVSVLSMDTVAVSNTSNAKNIQSMIDGFHKMATPFAGNSLLRAHYRDVPIGSSAWAISKLSAPDGQAATLPLPGGISFAMPAGTVTVASLRYLGSIQFKAEAFTPSEAAAEQLTNSATNFLRLFRAVEISVDPKGPDHDVKRLFDSIRVEQVHDRTVLSAEMPLGFIAKILKDAPAEAAAPAAPPAKSKNNRGVAEARRKR